MFGFGERLKNLSDSLALRKTESESAFGGFIFSGGGKLVNFASNDYLGVSSRLDWQGEFLRALAEKGGGYFMGSGSSRLLGCNAEAFAQFESFAAKAYSVAAGERRACLFFNCGYHANAGILPALATPRDLIIADKLSHASLIDALRLSPAKWLRYPHADMEELDKILTRRRAEFENVFIATESVFSMDGDVSDIAALAEIKKRHDAFLYIDEAHSFGVFGARGLGLCAGSGRLADVDLAMCTLGKAAGGEGAFAVCSPETREMLVNKCRTFIYSTAVAPIAPMWAKFVLEKIFSMDAERRKLAELAEIFRKNAPSALGTSQIAPIVAGENSRALEISAKLRERGFCVPPVRHPTVPQGTARLRFSLCASHDAESVAEAAALAQKLAEGAR